MKKQLIKLLQGTILLDYLMIFKQKNFPKAEERQEFELRKKFYSQFIKKGDLVFDVGANLGNRTEVFLSLGAKVVAFEPQPDCFRFLKRKFGNSIFYESAALGPETGEMEMLVSDTSTISSLSKEFVEEVKRGRFKEYNWDKKIMVQITTMDIMIQKYGVPDFCKIDVEGFELEVLKGLSKPINYLSFEFTIPEFLNKAVECIKYLSALSEIKFNYSLLESMALENKDWMSPESTITIIEELYKGEMTFGDIYGKFEN